MRTLIRPVIAHLFCFLIGLAFWAHKRPDGPVHVLRCDERNLSERQDRLHRQSKRRTKRMPKLTVFLVRSGETVEDVVSSSRQQQLRLHQKVDPPMTAQGYKQAQDTFLALVKGICDQTPVPAGRGDSDGDGVVDPLRNMACFSAPLKSCQSTALMLSAAGLASQDKLTWRYTTVEAASSPSAVPVVTINDLCAAQPEIVKCGGVTAVVDAGLLHTAAAPWNDARIKCPFMKVCVQDMKETAGDFVKAWKEDRHVNPPRRVLDVQYLWLTNPLDPWSLAELTPKVNVSVDMLGPNKYLTPPRKGNLECKLQQSANSKAQSSASNNIPAKAVADCVWKARQVGCDTVIFTVPTTVMQCMMEEIGGSSGSTIATDCAVMTLTAVVDDVDGADGVDWVLVGAFSTQQLQANPAAAVPYFSGTVDCLVQPPEGKDPASVPANQWSTFPPPEPENIPDDYPDLYVFAPA